MVWIPRGIWLLLSLRLLIAAVCAGTVSLPTVVLTVGFFWVGLTLNRSAPIALLITSPFLATFVFFGMLPSVAPQVLSVCSLCVGSLLSNRADGHVDEPTHLLFLDSMATWIAVGTLVHFGNLPGSASIASRLISQGVFGFDDPLFLLTDANLWLTAWALYRLWLSRESNIVRVSCGTGMPPRQLGSYPFVRSPIRWIGVWTGVVSFAWLIQRHYRFPDWYGGLVSFAPFEDIHAFGSVSGALFVGAICCIRPNRGGWFACTIALGAVTLVVLSYSRATWLWATAGTLGVIYLRLPRRVGIILVVIGIGLVGVICKIAPKLRASNGSYATRVADLVEVKNWSQRDAPRLLQYRLSVSLIHARPWTGHGAGSTRRRTGDFSHNFILQVAAENGLPAAVLMLMGIVGAILSIVRALVKGVATIETCALFAATLTYLGTQFTANAINIYPSQAFFFWPVLAMLYLLARKDLNRAAQAPSP